MSFVDHDTSICKYYNPYFDSDCNKGSTCPFRHLRPDKFIGYCSKLYKDYPFSPSDRAMSRMAYTLLRNGQYSQALRAYHQILKLYPLSAFTVYHIGQCHEHMRNFEFAGISYRRAISSNPNVSAFHRDYANFLYTQLKNIEQAQYHFEEALRLQHNFYKNDYGLSHFGLGELLCKSMDYIQGLKHIQIACELHPQNHKFEDAWIKWNDVVKLRSKDEKEHKITPSAPQICDQTNNDRELGYSRREFNRFITEKIIAGAIGGKYIKQFETLQVNDLRYFEFIDAGYLETQIGMNALHILLCIKQMDKFKRKCKEFDEWLKSIDVYYEYSSLLASFGILTFESFYKYINTIDDILHVLGAWNRDDAKYIFENTPKR
eukprot:744352_1